MRILWQEHQQHAPLAIEANRMCKSTRTSNKAKLIIHEHLADFLFAAIWATGRTIAGSMPDKPIDVCSCLLRIIRKLTFAFNTIKGRSREHGRTTERANHKIKYNLISFILSSCCLFLSLMFGCRGGTASRPPSTLALLCVPLIRFYGCCKTLPSSLCLSPQTDRSEIK